MSRDTASVLGSPSADPRDERSLSLRTRDLLEGISDAVIAIDVAGVVTYWGSGAAELYGVAASDALGQPLDRLYRYRWDEPDEERRAWVALERDGRWRGRNVHVLPSGSERHVDSTVTVLRDDEGRRTGLLAVIRDETARIEAERARRAAEEALRETVEALEVERDKLAKVIGALPVGIGITDPQGTTLSMNEAGLRLHGFRSQAEMHAELPRYLERFELRRLDGAPLPFDEWPAAKAMRGEFVSGYELVLRNRDAGTERIASYSALPVRNRAGEVVLLAYVMQDVTEAKRGQQLIEEHNEQLRETDRRKDEFLAMLSHELRNPLAPIRNSLVLLERSPPDAPAVRRARDVLRRQTEQLSRLVDDLLDVSRIAHGKIEVRLERIDAREVVRRAYADAKELFDQRGLDLLLSEPGEPLWVDADATRLAQMLGNLLHNALKFTPPRGVVQVRVVRRGGACEVSVRDTGLGIEPSQLARIFEPFVQVEEARRGRGGLGLGLALVRELATRQGGSVRARSAGPGKGAELVIELPLAGARGGGPDVRARAATGPALSVLVVDDNEDAGATLVDLLAIGGHAARFVTTGAAAIEAAAAGAPDVLLCDVGLPDLSGHDVIRAIRATPGGGALFAIALTGYAQPEDREAALAAGFDAHLAKPSPLEELDALLARAADRAKAQR